MYLIKSYKYKHGQIVNDIKKEQLQYRIFDKADQFTCVGVLCSEGATPSEPPTGLYAKGGWLEADITSPRCGWGALLAAQMDRLIGAKHGKHSEKNWKTSAEEILQELFREEGQELRQRERADSLHAIRTWEPATSLLYGP